MGCCSYNKNEPILSASTLKADLDVAVNLINKIIEEKNAVNKLWELIFG